MDNAIALDSSGSSDRTRLKRYEVLDSWRGICACLVVLYHFDVQSHIFNSGLVRSGYMCVDFFFVLSGFVITENYRDRLIGGFPVRKFVLLRLGRVYPLHLCMLAILALHEAAKIMSPGKIPFGAPENSLPALVANIFLVHSLGIFHFISWNGPSWSISVEFYVYLIFALAIVLLRKRLWLAEIATVIIAPLFLMHVHQNIDITYDWGLVRCAYGFSLGALCYRAHEKYLAGRSLSPALMSAVELLLLLATGFFMSATVDSKASLTVPYIFAAVILVFAQERGLVSRLLLRKPFLVLGALSYSIYMTHFLVHTLFYNAANAFGKLRKTDAFLHVMVHGADVKMIALPPWEGDLLFVPMLAAVIAASYCTRRWIEKPANDWFRRVAKGGRQDSGLQAERKKLLQ